MGDSLGDALELGGDGPADLSLLPADAPIFDQLNQAPAGSEFVYGTETVSLGDGAPDLRDTFASAPRLEVGGGPSHTMFEMGPGSHGLSFDNNNNYLAMEPNQGFGATTGNFSAQPQPMPAPTTVQPINQPTAQSPMDWQRDAVQSSRGHLLGDSTGGGESQMQGADTHGVDGADRGPETHSEAPQHTTYTVHKGDNLWDIAHTHLGDGTRWEEIYDLNKSVLGDNPRLIMPGTELQLPGGDTIADASLGQSDYTVQPGDNLWDISKDHLGGGQNWHELYSHNEAVVGSNPDMIHPGQHLQLDGSHAGAAGHDVSHSLAHNPTHSHAHTATPGHNGHQLAHHDTAHGADHNAGHTAGSGHAGQAQSQHTPAAKIAGSGGNAQMSQPSGGGELQAKAQSLSSIQTYGDGTAVHDSATSVPNSQL